MKELTCYSGQRVFLNENKVIAVYPSALQNATAVLLTGGKVFNVTEDIQQVMDVLFPEQQEPQKIDYVVLHGSLSNKEYRFTEIQDIRSETTTGCIVSGRARCNHLGEWISEYYTSLWVRETGDVVRRAQELLQTDNNPNVKFITLHGGESSDPYKFKTITGVWVDGQNRTLVSGETIYGTQFECLYVKERPAHIRQMRQTLEK